MAEDFIPLEIELVDKHVVRYKTTRQSLVSAIQRNIVQMNNIKEEEEYLNNPKSVANMTLSPTENKPLNPSITQSSGQFFREDSGRISIDQIGSKYKAKPHSVIFRPKMFLRYFVIRLIFNHLGPLILLYGLFSIEWLNFCKNLGYWGFNKRVLYTYGRLFQNIAIILCFVFYPFNDCTNYYIYMYIIANLLECVAIAIKLSFYHLSKQNLIMKYDMEQVGNYVEKCVDADEWVIQSDETIQEEIKSSMERQQVEETSFVAFFMIDPHEEMMKKIDGHQIMTEKYKQTNDKFIGDAKLMMKEVITFANNNDCWRKYIAIALILAVIRLSINVLLELINHNEMNPLLSILGKSQSLFYYFTIICFMLFTYRDLNTKVFCLSQISHLVSGQKVEAYEETKLFPTLNLLCITSLVSWVNMRKVFLDYGLQFTKRLTYIVSFIMILNLITLLGCFILFYLKLTTMTTTFFVSIDFIIVAIFFIMIVLQGARINDHFGIHKGLLRKNLFVLQQLAIQAFITPEYQFTPTDYIFKALSEIIIAVKEKGYIEENQLQSYITFALSSIENVYNDLDFYEKDKPYMVLGIAMTYKLVLSIVISVGGVVITWLFNMFILQK